MTATCADVTAVVTCLRCGGDLHPVTFGRIIAGREGRAVLECAPCKRQFLLSVLLTPFVEDLHGSASRAVACGTETGYKRHLREGTEPCVACREAWAQGKRRRKAG